MGQITELAKAGKFDEAIQIAKRLLPIIEKMAGKRHPLSIGQIAGSPWTAHPHSPRRESTRLDRARPSGY